MKRRILVFLIMINISPLQAQASLSVESNWGLPVEVQQTSKYEVVSLQSSNLKIQYSVGIQKSGASSLVELTKSIDYGQTWSAPLKISKESASAESIQGATNQTGQDIVLSWRQYSGGWSQALRFSHDFGQTWSEIILLEGVNSKISSFISNDGKKIVLLPTDNTNSTWMSIDGGLTWKSSPLNIGKALNDYSFHRRNYSRDRQSVITSNIVRNGSRNTVQFSISRDAGYSWTTPKMLVVTVNNPYSSNNATTAAISNDGKHIAMAWKSGAEGNDFLSFVISHDGGLNWSSPVQISSSKRPLTGNLNYQIVMSEDGRRIQGAWGERSLISPTIWDIVTNYSIDGGVSWGLPEQISKDNRGTYLYQTSNANFGVDDTPAGIAMTQDGTSVVLAWSENDNFNSLNYFAIKNQNEKAWRIERINLYSNEYCPGCVLTSLRISEDGKNITNSSLIGDSIVTNNFFGILQQNPLTWSNLISEGYVGQTIVLNVAGGSGSGKIEFKVSGKECVISDNKLTAKIPTSCNVIATKVSAGIFTSISSELKTFSFVIDPKVLAAEAEAKAAAELKAKQDAEAKAAAELKAKQDAEAKAAAEKKAKQEAEAKAVADKAALTKAQSELVAANAALADAQKVNRELQTQLNSVEAQFKIVSDSVSLIQGQVSQLNSKLAAALAGQNALTAKLKKVCSAKPKPKGC